MPKEGICPECLKWCKNLSYRHPKTDKLICQNCYNRQKTGKCSNCGEMKVIPYHDRKTGGKICAACYLNPERKGQTFLANETLEQLMKDCQANVRLMSVLLENQGIELTRKQISRRILKDKRLSKLAREIRRARPRKRAKVAKKQIAEAQNNEVTRLPLDKLEKKIMMAKGKSILDIAKEVNALVPQVEARIMRSIPAKFGLPEGQFQKAKEIFEREEGRLSTWGSGR